MDAFKVLPHELWLKIISFSTFENKAYKLLFTIKGLLGMSKNMHFKTVFKHTKATIKIGNSSISKFFLGEKYHDVREFIIPFLDDYKIDLVITDECDYFPNGVKHGFFRKNIYLKKDFISQKALSTESGTYHIGLCHGPFDFYGEGLKNMKNRKREYWYLGNKLNKH